MNAAQSLIAITIGICTLMGFAAGLVRHLVKHYLAELRPDGNGGRPGAPGPSGCHEDHLVFLRRQLLRNAGGAQGQ